MIVRSYFHFITVGNFEMDRVTSSFDLELMLKRYLANEFQMKLLKEFSCLKNDEERIGYVMPLLEGKNFVPDKVSVGLKSLRKSIEARCKGNDEYKKRNYCSAIKLYSKAIALAPHPLASNYENFDNNESKTALSLAVANRSVLLFDLKKYEYCLNDISFALSVNYPQHLRHKLYSRRLKCFHALGRTNEIYNTLQAALNSLSLADDLNETTKKSLKSELEALAKTDCSQMNNQKSHPPPATVNISYGRNKVLEDFSDCVEVKSVGSKGHGLFATRDINIGDVIGIEKPFASVLNEDCFYTNCHNCCKMSRTLIPCLHCSVAMFCGEDCSKSAWEKYHSLECEMIPALLHCQMFTTRVALAMRIVIKASNLFESLNDFCNSIELLDECKEEQLETSYFYDQKREVADYFRVYRCPTNSDLRCNEQLLHYSFQACSLISFLDKISYFFLEYNGIHKTKLKKFIALLLLRHMQNFFFEMNSYVEKSNGIDVGIIAIGTAVYSTLNLASHSCDPNMFYYTYQGNQTVWRILKKIKCGEQIFNSIGPLYFEDTLTKRREDLKRAYIPSCKCIACTENWPTYKELMKQKYRLKCEFCGSELPSSEHFLRYGKCRVCHQQNNVNKLKLNLKVHLNTFVEKSSDLHFTDVIKLIEFLDKAVCKPAHEFSNCEVFLKNYFIKMLCSDDY